MTGQKESGIYAIRQARPGFFEVASRLTGELHEVKVNKGRFIGPPAAAALKAINLGRHARTRQL